MYTNTLRLVCNKMATMIESAHAPRPGLCTHRNFGHKVLMWRWQRTGHLGFCEILWYNTVWCRYSAVNFLTTIHKRHPIARYKVSSVDPESDWYYAWVPAIIYAMSYYIWTALSRHWTVYYYMVFIRRCISNEQNLIWWRLVYFCKLILKCDQVWILIFYMLCVYMKLITGRFGKIYKKKKNLQTRCKQISSIRKC